MMPAVAIGVGLACLAGIVFWLQWRSQSQRAEAKLADAKQLFHQRREWLEAKFVTLASQSGKPRGLEWADCDFEDAVALARDRRTGQLRAFVGVTISFNAIEGGPMEDVEAVGNLRAATSVFILGDDGQWFTEGRAIFNLNPHQAIEHFHHELEEINVTV